MTPTQDVVPARGMERPLAAGPLYVYLHARYVNGREEWMRRYEWHDPVQLILFDHKYGSSLRFRPKEMPLARLSLEWIEPFIARADTATIHIVLAEETESVIRLFLQGSMVAL